MTYIQPFNLPTLQETFGKNTKLMTGLRDAGFTSVVPVMMIPQGGLQQYYGIGPGGDKDATQMLLKQRLGRHQLSDKLSEFVRRQFNSVVDAPISVLDVAVGYSYPVHSPLESITLFRKYEPHMCIQDLINMTKKDVMEVLNGNESLGERGPKDAVRDPQSDMRHIESRLEAFRLEFSPRPIVKLRAVNR